MADPSNDQVAWDRAHKRSTELWAQIELILDRDLPQHEIDRQVSSIYRELKSLAAQFEGNKTLPICEHLRQSEEFVNGLVEAFERHLSSPLVLEWKRTFEQFRKRQGTELPDFREFHEQRKEFDRRLQKEE